VRSTALIVARLCKLTIGVSTCRFLITSIEPTADCREETEQAYLRILSQSILDFVKNGGKIGAAGTGAAAATADRLDLSGSGREFLTKELASSFLEPMQQPGILTHFGLCQLCWTVQVLTDTGCTS
jgi:hypothetical protein